jgi:phenylacetate-CoA ligase
MMSDSGVTAGFEPQFDAGELAALQLERLQATLRHAYQNVEHYRRKFDAVGR